MKVNPLIAALILATTLAAGTTNAADPSDWRGFYAGAELGAKWGDTRWQTTAVGDPPSPPGILDSSTPRSFDPLGVRAGGLLGYNFRSSDWVYGLELDMAYTDDTDSSKGIPGCTILCFAGAPGPGVDRSSVTMQWDASARLRLGRLLMPNLLLYGTGGAAWQHIEASATCENTLADPVCLVSPPFALKTETKDTTLTGWTIGAGAEWKLAEKWLLRGEYRYADYGTWSGEFFKGQPAALPGSDTTHFKLGVQTHLFALGLLYQFN